MSKGPLVTLQKASEMADVSVTTVKRLVVDGWVPAVEIAGRRWVYYHEFLQGAWAREQQKDPRGRGYGNKGRRTDLGY